MLKHFLNFGTVSVNPAAIEQVVRDEKAGIVTFWMIGADGSRTQTQTIEDWDREVARINALDAGTDYRAQLRQLTEAVNRLTMNMPHSIRIHP